MLKAQREKIEIVDNRTLDLNGYRFVTGSLTSIVDRIFELDVKSCLVITPNLSIWGAVEKNKKLEFVKTECEFHIADGWPIALALSIKHRRMIRRTAGSDLLPELINYCSKNDLRLAIVGGHKNYPEKFSRVLSKKNMNCVHKIFDVRFSSESSKIDTVFVSDLRKFEPDVLVICLGFPKQEYLGLALRGDLKVPILCLGAALDFMVFPKLRAPKMFIFLKLEWLWRLLHEPKRLFKRYYFDALGGLPSLVRSIFL